MSHTPPSRVIYYAEDLKAKPKVPRAAVTAPQYPKRAGLITKLMRAKREVQYWAVNGFRLASPEERRRRNSICQGCELWDPAGNFGLGECRHKACGCTGAKRALATSRCPLNPPKWDRV